MILGAGVAGMAAAWRLKQAGRKVLVIEAESSVGGASRTVQYGGFRFDLGGHRFYSRNAEVLGVLHDLLGKELLTVRRKSHIFFQRHLIEYPLSFFNALKALGPVQGAGVAASYARERLRVSAPEREDSFEEWVVRRFGKRLYEIYFRPYSEKVWGIPCRELSADFAAQRIGGLSFTRAVVNALFPSRKLRTLASSFYYPSAGFGSIPEAMAAALEPPELLLGSQVERILHDGTRVNRVVYRRGGELHEVECEALISTFAVDQFVRYLEPSPAGTILDAASQLRFRDMVIVFLTLSRERVTDDHWIYFPEEELFSRIHEPRNWSRKMAPAGSTSLVVEIFCSSGDPVFGEKDQMLASKVVSRLCDLGLIRSEEVTGATVRRLRKAYPLYFRGYKPVLRSIMDGLAGFSNLQLAGRNARYLYTSADIYLEMGFRAAENTLGAKHDLDKIGSSGEYAES